MQLGCQPTVEGSILSPFPGCRQQIPPVLCLGKLFGFSRGHVPAALLNESVKDLLQMSEMFMGTSLLNSYLMAETIRTQGQSSSFYLVSQKSLVCMTSIPPQYHTTFTQQSEWHGKDIWISRISENEIIVWKWATPACEHILGRFWRFH